MVAITRLGDMLQMSPTIVGLKNENPRARITVLIDKQFAGICKGIPGIDEVYVVDLSYLVRCLHRENEGVVEAFTYVDELVNDLRSRQFDYCLNMSNSSYTALLIKMLNVKENRGWLSDEEGFRLMADPWAMLFSAFVYHSNRDYNSLNLVDIFRCSADVQAHPRSLRFNVAEDERRFVREFLLEHRLDGTGPLICIQAGASQAKRQWAPARFGYLAKLLIEQLNARLVFTGASSEQHIIDQIFACYNHPQMIQAVGKTDFGQLAALLETADVLITGDTGPMHLSVAVGTPVVALFLASALAFETGPYSEGNFVMQPQISCSPCNPNYPCSRPDCHDQITPELVAYLAKLRLQTPRGQEQHISIPRSVADPSQVIVYRSVMDDDGFLDFISMNGGAGRHGQPGGFFEGARAAYRSLWKEEFCQIGYSQLPAEPAAPVPMVHPAMQGLQQAIDLGRQGQQYLAELRRLIEDPQSEPALLRAADQRLRILDSKIEEVCLAYPIAGAVIRIFIMEKENMRGDDPLELTAETAELYHRLIRRGSRLAQLFAHFYQEEQRRAL